MMLYADPGSGAMIWQLGLAIFFGGAFYFARLKEWTRRKFKNSTSDVQPDSSPRLQESVVTSETK